MSVKKITVILTLLATILLVSTMLAAANTPDPDVNLGEAEADDEGIFPFAEPEWHVNEFEADFDYITANLTLQEEIEGTLESSWVRTDTDEEIEVGYEDEQLGDYTEEEIQIAGVHYLENYEEVRAGEYEVRYYLDGEVIASESFSVEHPEAGPRSHTVDFEVESLAGQDFDDTVELDLTQDRIDFEISGVTDQQREDNALRFNLRIDGEEGYIGPDEEMEFNPRRFRELDQGVYDAEIVQYTRDQEIVKEGEIEVVEEFSRDADRPDREDDRDDMRGTEIEIESVNGQEFSDLEELDLTEGLTFEFANADELSSVVGIELGDASYGITPDNIEDTYEIPGDRRFSNVEEGEKTLKIEQDRVGLEMETDVEVVGTYARDHDTSPENIRDRDTSDELEDTGFDQDYNPGFEGFNVDRRDDGIDVELGKDYLEEDESLTIGESVESLTEATFRPNRAGGSVIYTDVRVSINEKDPETVDSDFEIYDAIEVEGDNIELLILPMEFAVSDDWADEHEFDVSFRQDRYRGENTEVNLFYEDGDGWESIDGRITDSTNGYTVYSFRPDGDEYLLDTDQTTTFFVGADPDQDRKYAVSPQGQCEVFGEDEDLPHGYEEIDQTCAEYQEKQREIDRLHDRIDNTEEALLDGDFEDEEEMLERLEEAREELNKGNVDEAEELYEEVSEVVHIGFLRELIREVVEELVPFVG